LHWIAFVPNRLCPKFRVLADSDIRGVKAAQRCNTFGALPRSSQRR
jgi:hypothetical protein